MALVYPQLKPMLEASIRKVTVTVNWQEGLASRDLAIVQYVTRPMRGGLMPPAAVPAVSGGRGVAGAGEVPGPGPARQRAARMVGNGAARS